VESWLLDRTHVFQTMEGKEVHFVCKGTINMDEGPDIMGAVILIDGHWQTGDVEFHFSQRGWFSHGHHHDEKYNNVLLHVFYDKAGKKAVTQNGRVIPSIQYYPRNVNKTSKNISAKVELPSEIFQFGMVRVIEKIQHLLPMLSNVEELDLLLARKVGRAMGYSKNADSMERFVELTHAEWSVSPHDLRFRLLYLSGLSHIAELPDLSNQNWQLKPRMSRKEWKYFRLRPANFPHRRIIQFAQWINKVNGEPFQDLIFFMNASSVNLWTIPGFIRYFKKNIPDIGIHRIREILGNAVFPILAAYFLQIRNWERYESILTLIKQLPAGGKSKIFYQICPQYELKYRTKMNFIHQQGILQLREDYCINQFCAVCPFSKNVQTERNFCNNAT